VKVPERDYEDAPTQKDGDEDVEALSLRIVNETISLIAEGVPLEYKQHSESKRE
jgi:hypothetical protein